MRAFFLAFLTLIMLPTLFAGAAHAQSADRPNTILVLDGSGSMWGQIDGVNKIVIAREVIAEMLADMADDVSLGLTVYGHRQRGSCTDIETIVAPAPGTQDLILQAVNGINPRGRTPMTDAVIAAAQALRSTEEAATVILVSDGIENCNPDPCAIAAELEAAGVDFTAHVIGFDVASEPEARAQMQCIADNTGGQFLTADNATELSAALEQIVAALPTPMRIEAGIPPAFNMPTRPVTWTLLDQAGGVISTGTPGPFIEVDLFPGTYVAQATRQEPNGPQTYQTSFTVIEGQTDLVVVAMPPIVETSQITFTARVQPNMTVPASELAWTLFDAADTALLGPVVTPGGNVALLPGEYRLSVERANAGTRHEARFTVAPNTPQDVIVPLPALSVQIDFVARIGDVGGVTITDPVVWDVSPLNSNPVTTNPASFQMPGGAYRVTAYWTAQEIEQSVDFVVVDQPREIIVVFPVPAATATLSGPDQAPMGSMISVTWDGPGAAADTLSMGPVGGPITSYVNRVLIDGAPNPAMVLMPSEAGPFEIRYTDSVAGQVIARAPILSTPVTATLTVPSEIAIGSQFDVGWTGPNYPNDLIVITTPEASTHGYAPNRRATADGSIVVLTAPTEPGLYEVRYRMNQDGVVLARATVNVVAQIATITAPSTAVAGSTIEVAWVGPDQDNDYIGIGLPDRNGDPTWTGFTRTRDGNPLRLVVPSAPGEHMITYFLHENRTALVSVPITVTPAEATLTFAATAVAGSTLEVAWTGPDYFNDYIGIGQLDRNGDPTWENYTRTSEGTPLRLVVPPAPGDYFVTYFLGLDRTTLISVPLTVTAVESTLTFAATTVAGSTLEVAWTGPDYPNDYIGVGQLDRNGDPTWENYTRTSEGTPLRLLVPSTPGDYVITYFLGQDRTVLLSVPVSVTDAAASITAPSTAVAGSTIEVAWTGPDYARDYIGIGRVGAEGSAQWENYTRTAEGASLRLVTPALPGTYLIRYYVDQDRVVLAEMQITLTEPQVSVTAPASAVAGSTIDVTWIGPDYPRDYIGIGRVGAEGSARWENYTRTADGAPSRLVMPPVAGEYVIRYFVDQDRVVQAETQITLTAPEASITAPTTAAVGSTIEVSWIGPNYSRDYIGIGRVGAEGSARWENFTRTADGAPMRLLMPVEPGEYVLRYFIDQDRAVIAEVPITLMDVEATLTAPSVAEAGGTLQVIWAGPDYSRDFIALGPVGATGNDRWESYTRTDQGNPLTLNVPDQPGAYVLQYFIDQDRRSIAQLPITVQ